MKRTGALLLACLTVCSLVLACSRIGDGPVPVAAPPQGLPGGATSAAESYIANMTDDEYARLFALADVVLLGDGDTRKTFEAPGEIDSNDLMNAFLTLLDMSDEIESCRDSQNGLYYLPVERMTALLGQYFERFSFDPGLLTSPMGYDPLRDAYVIESVPLPGCHQAFTLQPVSARVLENGLVELTALRCDTSGDPAGHIPVRLCTMVLRITGEKSFLKRYSHTPIGDYPADTSSVGMADKTPGNACTAYAEASQSCLRLIELMGGGENPICFRSPADIAKEDAYRLFEVLVHSSVKSEALREGWLNADTGLYHIEAEQVTELLGAHLPGYVFRAEEALPPEVGNEARPHYRDGFCITPAIDPGEPQPCRLLLCQPVGEERLAVTAGFYEGERLAHTYTLYVHMAGPDDNLRLLSGYQTDYGEDGSRALYVKP